MATTKNTSKKNKGLATVGLAAGAVAAAAAAAGTAYYFYGAEGAKKHRAVAGKWADRFKREVIKDAKKVQAIDKKVMAAIIDRASRAYAVAQSVDPGEVRAAAMELKANWERLRDEVKRGGRSLKRAAAKKRPAKKAVKKSGRRRV